VYGTDWGLYGVGAAIALGTLPATCASLNHWQHRGREPDTPEQAPPLLACVASISFPGTLLRRMKHWMRSSKLCWPSPVPRSFPMHRKTSLQQGHLALSYALVDFIERHREDILSILCSMASHRSVVDEIERSKRVLLHWSMEWYRERPRTVDKMAVFHSSNILLYAYVLYGIIPSAYVNTIVIRPSIQVQAQSLAIHQLFKAQFDLAVDMAPFSQRAFIDKHQDADIVVFTGRYENAKAVNACFRKALFLFFGSGVNAVVIGPQFNTSRSLAEVIQARLFNSGQDCMCPNVFFVYKDIAKTFIKALLSTVKSLRLGARSDSAADYNPIFYSQVVQETAAYLAEHRKAILHGGRCCPETSIVDPVVLRVDLSTQTQIPEFFAPVFNLVVYDNPTALNTWLLSPLRTECSMCLSLFGEPNIHADVYRYYTVALEHTIFAQEDGNLPFGGYGPKVNYVSWKSQVQGRPLLISREVAHYFGRRAL